MKNHLFIRPVLLFILALFMFWKGSLTELPAQTIINDTFTGTNGTMLASHAPDTNLTGAPWFYNFYNTVLTPSNAISGNAAIINTHGHAIINLASNGSYTKPTSMTLSATLNPGTCTTDANPWNGVGLGFYNVAPSGSEKDFFNFLGLVLRVDGKLSLIKFNNAWGSTLIAETAYSLGTFVLNAPHTVTYTVNTTTGAISNVSLSDANGTQTYSFTTNQFTNANTAHAGFFLQSAGWNTPGTVDNFSLSTPSSGPGLTFSFTLPADYQTSAGVYDSTGKLVRTLWRAVPYLAGTYSGTWDGKNDAGTLLSAGTYTVKVLYHNVRYTWDGVIGNTFSTFTGNIYGFQGTPSQLAIDGTNAFLANGYTEGTRLIKRFSTATPNISNGVLTKDLGVNFTYVATDGTRFYVADTGSGWDTTNSTFVTSFNVSNNSPASFSSGSSVTISSPSNMVYSSCIDLSTTTPSTNMATGLAVQKSGSLLAVAHGPLNVVRLFNKTTGASAGTISVTNPQSLAFSPAGDLWVLSGTTAKRYSSVGSSNTLSTTITGFSQPLAVAVHPSDNNVVLFADGGTNQRIMAYNSTGTSLWNYGQAGGYDANGPAVTNDKFQFEDGFPVPLAIQSDGSFWVRDSTTFRMLHYTSARVYIEQMGSVWGNAYTSTVDPNTPGRVIASGWLEYQVDYTKDLLPGDPQASGGNLSWKLLKDWRPAASLTAYQGFSSEGLSTVVTLSNGRVYGLCNNSATGKYSVVELPASGGLRFTGVELDNNRTLYANGDLRYWTYTAGTQAVYKQSLTGFDASNNPQWGTATLLTSVSAGPTTPAQPNQFAGAQGTRFPITSSNVMVSFNPAGGVANSGMHLGGVTVGTSQWLWQGSPAVSTNIPLDGLGSFDIGDGVQYAGNRVEAQGRNIVYGYHGEFWNGTQADQFMNFNDDGLFIGQFGTSGDVMTSVAPTPTVADEGGVPGKGGNAFSPSLVTVGNEVYLWHNDESQHHGIHRWHLVGAKAVEQMSGSAYSGSSLALSATAPSFPAALVATAGNGQAALSWQAVAGASSYSVKWAAKSGGPYTVVTGVSGTTYTKTGLTNGTPYYFSVSAIVSSVESANSYEAKSIPFDPSIVVQKLGSAWSIGSNNQFQVTSANVNTGKFPISMHSMFNTLGLPRTNVGSKGYAIFNWDGAGLNKINLAPGFGVSVGSGWQSYARYLNMRFKIDGVEGLTTGDAGGLHANPTGSIDVTVSDTNWHVLTVFASNLHGNIRNDVYTLKPTGSSTPTAAFTIVESTNNVSFNHVLQYRFKGNVTLTVQQNTTPTLQSANITGLTID